jgi:hypothetical protein
MRDAFANQGLEDTKEPQWPDERQHSKYVTPVELNFRSDPVRESGVRRSAERLGASLDPSIRGRRAV